MNNAGQIWILSIFVWTNTSNAVCYPDMSKSCKLCRKRPQKTSNFEALSVRPFMRFDKIRFSIDRRFQKCIIVVKAFCDNSENSTFILTPLTKLLFAMNRQGPK